MGARRSPGVRHSRRVTTQDRRPAVAIVGGGIAGLAAAFFLRDRGVAVTVLEGSPRLGGKLATSQVAGIAVDEGAESLLARRPEGTDLIRAVGLAAGLVSPGTTSAGLWTRGQLRPLPKRQFMGVPADLDELSRTGILSPEGTARTWADLELPVTGRDGDVSVASYVGARLGGELVDRLVDPLLGGVYAGRSDELSFEATLPALARASGEHRSLCAAAAALLPPAARPPGAPRPADAARPPGAPSPPAPAQAAVFTTLSGGLGTLPPVLATASGAIIRTGAMVRGLARVPGGWRLTVGSAHAPELLDADAVILALPARPAGRLLSAVPAAAVAASGLGEIAYASMAIVTLAYPAAAFPSLPGGSGYLVPAVDGHPVKAVTFSTIKWPHLLGETRQAGLRSAQSAGDVHLVRCSVGRRGEEAVLQRDDAELAALAVSDLAAATGVSGAPVDARVTRWGGGLPQYTVGHLDRVRRIRASVAAQPGLAVCGAAFDGIGIPACIASARLAADQVLSHLESAAANLAAVRPAAVDPAAGKGVVQ